MVEIIKIDYKKSHQMLIEKIVKEYKIWSFIEVGKPFETIKRVSEEWGANRIVLGTNGSTGLSHLLMGSVAENVIRHSRIPIFIIVTKSNI